MTQTHKDSPLPRILQWTGAGRALVFVLAAASIWCLLAEMYGLCNMRTFTLFILIPATVALYAIAVLDRTRGDGRLSRGVMIGTVAGLLAAVAYDVFRLPFVFSDAWGMGQIGIPQMPLFKVFPRFGALILGQPLEQASYSLVAHLIGWVYHFSNGATFGVMFAALIGGMPRRRLGSVGWAAVFAMGLEACLLISPYTQFFGIHMTPRFVTVTILAHLVFGVAMGIIYLRGFDRARPRLAI